MGIPCIRGESGRGLQVPSTHNACPQSSAVLFAPSFFALVIGIEKKSGESVVLVVRYKNVLGVVLRATGKIGLCLIEGMGFWPVGLRHGDDPNPRFYNRHHNRHHNPSNLTAPLAQVCRRKKIIELWEKKRWIGVKRRCHFKGTTDCNEHAVTFQCMYGCMFKCDGSSRQTYFESSGVTLRRLDKSVRGESTATWDSSGVPGSEGLVQS